MDDVAEFPVLTDFDGPRARGDQLNVDLFAFRHWLAVNVGGAIEDVWESRRRALWDIAKLWRLLEGGTPHFVDSHEGLGR